LSYDMLTPLVFPKVNVLFKIQFVGVHFGVEAIILFQNARQASNSGINGTPMGNSLASVHFRYDIFQVTFAKRFDRNALQ
jgi:hypothetical protein